MSTPLVSIHLIVKDGAKYIERCLEGVKKQTYANIEVRVFDNASQDGTADIARRVMPDVEIIRFPQNYGLGGGFNRSLQYSHAPYVIMLCVDVMLEPDFVEKAVEAAEQNPHIGVVQGKIMRYNYEQDLVTRFIDTTGLQIYRSRRVVNRGHGEEDKGQYEKAGQIFCYEGAAPFFRRDALEDVRGLSPHRSEGTVPATAGSGGLKAGSRDSYEYLDEDFVWYADELDLGWRMLHKGWISWYTPRVRAAHDRQTTMRTSAGWGDFVKQRRTIPAFKRMLDYRNQRFAFLKNDFGINILRDTLFWLPRELMLLGYFLLFERTSLRAYTDFLRMLPLMHRKRTHIMRTTVQTPRTLRPWFL